jgi:polyhydroxyalkanoate synthesis regulator phasin
MSNKNLSTVATQVIEAYGITATNVINTYRFGGERVIGFIDDRFASVMDRSASTLSNGTRSTLIDGQQRVSGFYVKGLHFGTDRAQSVVGVAVDLATKGVSIVATNATRLDRQTNLNALDKLNRVVMPAASLLNSVAVGIEEGSTELVKRVAGQSMPAKAIATRKLNTAKRKAATTRKRVTKVAAQQVDDAVETGELIAQTATDQVNKQVKKAVATRKKIVKTATKRVSKAVSDTAIQTSNAARRVSRKAEKVAEAA